jgi:xanthine dehydrogenase YagS FAD-binding subunit
MAVIRDVMPAFELAQPNSISDAQKLLEQQGENGWVLAGGMDSFDWLKDRIKKPKVVVDLSGIAELKGVRATADGIEIGAMTTLTEVVQHPVIREKYKLLAESAELACIIHVVEGAKSLLCYKHVVKTVFGATKEASA